jgi:hypothetical protein
MEARMIPNNCKKEKKNVKMSKKFLQKKCTYKICKETSPLIQK